MIDEPTEPRSGLFGALYRYRRVLAVAGVVWFTFLMVGGLYLSQLDARLGLNVFGPRTFVAGEPAVIRVVLRELRYDRVVPLGHAEARLFDAEGAEVGRWPLRHRAGDLVQGSVTPEAAGAHRLEVHTEVKQGALMIEMPITVSAKAAAVPLPGLATRRPPPQPDRGPVKLEVRPADHVIAGNLPGRLIIRAMDEAGRPVAEAPIKLRLREGKTTRPLPEEVTTDRHGLAEVVILPQHPVFWLDLEAPESFATRRMKHTATQLVAVAPKRVVKPGERVPFGIKALHRTGALFVDVWHGDRWLGAEAAELRDGEAKLMVPMPATLTEDPALVWVQAYRSAYLPGQARGGVYVLVSRKAPTEALRALADMRARQGRDGALTGWLSEHAEADPVLARYLLGLSARPDADPPLLADSSESARQTVGALKGTWQRRFVIGLLGTGVLLMLMLIWLVRHNYRDVQRRWTEAGGGEEALRGTRKGVLMDAVYIIGILAIFLLGLVQLVLTIRW